MFNTDIVLIISMYIACVLFSIAVIYFRKKKMKLCLVMAVIFTIIYLGMIPRFVEREVTLHYYYCLFIILLFSFSEKGLIWSLKYFRQKNN
jgi:hypothetical protein